MVWLPIRRRKISPDHPLSFHHGSSSQWRHMRIKLLNYYITFVSGKVQDRVYTGLKKERWWLIWAMQYVWVGFPMFDIYLLGPKIHYIENGRSFCRVSKTLDENLSKLRPHSKSDFAWPGRPKSQRRRVVMWGFGKKEIFGSLNMNSFIFLNF